MSMELYSYLRKAIGTEGIDRSTSHSFTSAYSREDLLSETYLTLVNKGVDKPDKNSLELITETITKLKDKRGRSYRSLTLLPAETEKNGDTEESPNLEVLKDLFIALEIDRKIAKWLPLL